MKDTKGIEVIFNEIIKENDPKNTERDPLIWKKPKVRQDKERNYQNIL